MITGEAGRSPGGIEENEGNASALRDKLITGIDEVIEIHPVKVPNFRYGPTLKAVCCRGPRVNVPLPSCAPVELTTLIVKVAVSVTEGFATATPVAVSAKVTNLVVGFVSAFTAASPTAA